MHQIATAFAGWPTAKATFVHGVRHTQMKDIENLARALKQNFSDSEFMLEKPELIDSLEEKYSCVPAALKQLYEALGYGSIEHSHAQF